MQTFLRSNSLSPFSLFVCFAMVIFILCGTPNCFAEDSRDPNDWYERARADFDAAQVLFDKTTHYAIVCFHAHQAAEKTLKGALISHGLVPNKFHYNAKMAEDLSRFDIRAGELIAPCKMLDGIYVSSRYPRKFGIQFDQIEASSCVQNAKAVLELIEQDVNAEVAA